MPARREGAKTVRRPPAKPRGSGGLGRGLATLASTVAPHWPWVLAVLLVGSGGILGLALVFPGGSIATPLNVWQSQVLGWAAPLLAFWLTVFGVAVLWCHLQPEATLPLGRALGAAV